MEELTVNEMRTCQLNILEYIDKVCKENHIEYSLIGGSLLGSIRHGGFIPWDDDIDVMFRRDEYNRFISLFTSELNSGNYELWHYSKRETYQPFAKLYDNRTILGKSLDHMWTNIGVHVDIFPYDALPSKENERILFMKHMQKRAEDLVSTGFPAFVSGSKWYYVAARLFLRLPRFINYHGKNKEIASSYDNESQKYFNSDAEEMGFLASKYFEKEHFPRSIFSEYEDIKFENLSVRKIKDHDTYLTQLFGNYMQLPPENKRITHDFYQWYWKDSNNGN
ncbi:LicD family protein [Lactococcus petauri]|uniref:LicD family protein n=1 Tax=Lactococcus petauri TaxID=1940789 RepID=UPI0022E780EF|nr:LicD family protein [Lactococcus petauri]